MADDRMDEPQATMAYLGVDGAEALLAELEPIAEGPGDDASRRLAAAKHLREALERSRAHVKARFESERRAGSVTARAIAGLTDAVVIAAFRFVAEKLLRLGAPTKAEQIALAAVGGYGRGEMAPHSDVDLLFITPYKQTAWGESVIEATLYILWDLKFKVGHATRSADECVRLAASDLTIKTSLLEKRFLAGDQGLFDSLSERLWTGLFSSTGPEFVADKLAERDARHARAGDSRFLLEPNVKESKGALRDLQTLYWIAKYLYRADEPEDLVEKGVFTEEEVTRFKAASDHLWTVRCALHYTAGRAQEKLTFDLQVELAERLGYRATDAQRPVERLMQRYFLAAKAVGDLTRIFCAALEAQHKKSPPFLGGLMRLFKSGPEQPEEEWLTIKDGRLTLTDLDHFEREPVAMLRLVHEGVRRGVLIHSDALRRMHQNRRLVDDAFRADPEARRLLLDLISDSKDPVRALRRLSEINILGRLIPEFGRITGLMQFNMYHHYTVDEHTIVALDMLRKIYAGEMREAHPIETKIAQELDDLRVISVALLLHDIGKGLPDDHSILGEGIAREVCADLDMTAGETELIAWLVRWHLIMSDTAQRRDISDPATVRDFADLVRSPKRLKLLYLLTACDIRAVGPGVWTNWKAQLLRDLYEETWAELTGDEGGRSRAERAREAQRMLRAALNEAGCNWSDEVWENYVKRFAPTYWLSLPTELHLLHATMAQADSDDIAAGEKPPLMRIEIRPAPERGAAVVAIVTADHSGLFARMAGAIALAGASVVDARGFTTKDGAVINTFWIADDEGEATVDAERQESIRRAIGRALRGEVVARDALRERRKLRPRERPFDVAPFVAFDNAASDVFTVIEVNARDRVGLLYDLARALAGANINISSALIATYGEHAVDVFYVKDLFGMKVTSVVKQRKIEEALLEAIERSGEAA
ncbi:MAG: [protein-PII] uridylyltransferase [Neomegalonema sp.]|nr:[protein-PII] uridylyltransferase [Neomegalonema sp.]